MQYRRSLLLFCWKMRNGAVILIPNFRICWVSWRRAWGVLWGNRTHQSEGQGERAMTTATQVTHWHTHLYIHEFLYIIQLFIFNISSPGILTPLDEFQFWSDTAAAARKGDARERAEHFQELFQPISREYGGLESSPLVEIVELIELTQDTLDEVWKQTEFEPVYPENRMKHLMDVIGSALGQAVQSNLSQEDLWKGPFSRVKESLRLGHSICERWIQVCDTLTSQFWKRYSPHPWKGNKFEPSRLPQLANRLNEVFQWATCSSAWKELLKVISLV